MARIEKITNRSTILLDHRAPKRALAFAGLHPTIITSKVNISDAVARAVKNTFWISYSSDLTDALVSGARNAQHTLGSGLFIHELSIKTIPALSRVFQRIVYSIDGGFLPPEELADVFQANHPENLVIGGFVDAATQTITLWRGNLQSLSVPYSAFPTSGKGIEPDFNSFSIIDCGLTVKLGDYEAAVDAILYEYDPAYRRSISKMRKEKEKTFGASLRRLRKQRGLSQEDFQPDLSAKTIARIELGKSLSYQKSTLEALAKHLDVNAEEIESY